MEQPEDGCCCCRCCESLSTANGTTLDPYPMQPQQEHLEIFQWIGLETAELLPAYITRYYNNLHHQVNQQSHLRSCKSCSSLPLHIYLSLSANCSKLQFGLSFSSTLAISFPLTHWVATVMAKVLS